MRVYNPLSKRKLPPRLVLPSKRHPSDPHEFVQNCISENAQKRVLAIIRKRQENGAFSQWEVLCGVDSDNTSADCRKPQRIPLGGPEGQEGNIILYPNVIDTNQQGELYQEITTCGKLRQYTIQNGPEPRKHVLLHEKATHDKEQPQPGYKYGVTTMKAIPLDDFPKSKAIAGIMASVCEAGKENPQLEKEGYWSIGVELIVYPSRFDGIGFHSDDKQNESNITTLVVSSPLNNRRHVVVANKHSKKEKKKRYEGEVEICLFLDSCDAYKMDGKMQENYFHQVPSISHKDDAKTPRITPLQEERIVIVFREGQFRLFERDSGFASPSLLAWDRVRYLPGNNIPGLLEGHIYTRRDMTHTLYAHQTVQKGVSGNATMGCDAIVVSGKGDLQGAEGDPQDNLESLYYASTTLQGAKGLVLAYQKETPVRVFRSSNLGTSPYRATIARRLVGLNNAYRYDGLYQVREVSLRTSPGEKFQRVHGRDIDLEGYLEPVLFYLTRAGVRDTCGLARSAARSTSDIVALMAFVSVKASCCCCERLHRRIRVRVVVNGCDFDRTMMSAKTGDDDAFDDGAVRVDDTYVGFANENDFANENSKFTNHLTEGSLMARAARLLTVNPFAPGIPDYFQND